MQQRDFAANSKNVKNLLTNSSKVMVKFSLLFNLTSTIFFVGYHCPPPVTFDNHYWSPTQLKFSATISENFLQRPPLTLMASSINYHWRATPSITWPPPSAKSDHLTSTAHTTVDHITLKTPPPTTIITNFGDDHPRWQLRWPLF